MQDLDSRTFTQSSNDRTGISLAENSKSVFLSFVHMHLCYPITRYLVSAGITNALFNVASLRELLSSITCLLLLYDLV